MSKKALVLFCGAGGSTLGVKQAGYETVGVDSWEVATATHLANGFVTVRADLTRAKIPKKYRGWDLLWSSFPCQGFSAAASYRNAATPDGVLATLRAVETVRPRLVITENVKGLKAPRHLAHFQLLLGGLVAFGYKVEWRVLDCSHYGLPQRRHRLFVVARRDDWPVWPDPTHLDNPKTMRKALGWPKGVMVERRQKQGPAHNRVKVPDASADLPSPTVTTQSPNQWIGRKKEKEFRVSPQQAAQLQGFPKKFVFLGTKGQQYTQIGNAVPPLMAKILVEANQ